MRRALIATAYFATLHTVVPAEADVATRVVARTGQPLPDATDLSFQSVGSGVLNNAGEVAFYSRTTGGDVVWAGQGSLVRAFESGGRAPGTDGIFGSIDASPFNINHPGHITFIDDVAIGSLTRNGLWSGPIGNVSLVAQSGSAAPGGGTFSRIHGAQVSESGHLVLLADASGVGRNVWGNIAGPLQRLRETTEFHTGQGDGPAALNNRGEAVYSIDFGEGLAFSTPSSPLGREIAHTGQPAPGGGTYQTLLWHGTGRIHDINDNGHMAMEAIRMVDGKQELTIVAGPPDNLRTVLRGQPVAGYPGHQFTNVTTIGINDRRQIAFSGNASMSGNTWNPSVWRLDAEDDLELVAPADQSMPQGPEGLHFVSPILHALNDQGHMLVSGWQYRPGDTEVNNDRALYVVDDQLNYHLLVYDGMDLTLPDGTRGIVDRFSLARGKDDTWGEQSPNPYQPTPRHGRPMLLSDAGEVIYTVHFTNGTSAVLVSAIPEPVTGAVLSAAGVLLLRRRRVRRTG